MIMAYIRKTHDEWEVQGLYSGEWETLFTEETREAAKRNRKSVTMKMKKMSCTELKK